MGVKASCEAKEFHVQLVSCNPFSIWNLPMSVFVIIAQDALCCVGSTFNNNTRCIVIVEANFSFSMIN